MAADYSIVHHVGQATPATVKAALYHLDAKVGGDIALTERPSGSGWYPLRPADLTGESIAANTYRVVFLHDDQPAAVFSPLFWDGSSIIETEADIWAGVRGVNNLVAANQHTHKGPDGSDQFTVTRNTSTNERSFT